MASRPTTTGGKAGALVRLAAAAALAAGLAGCASRLVDAERPVGVGADVNALKKSPCACMTLPNAARAG